MPCVTIQLTLDPVGVEKLGVRTELGAVCGVVRLRFVPFSTASGSVGWLRNRTSRLMFCAAATRKNCSRANFIRRNRRRRSPV